MSLNTDDVSATDDFRTGPRPPCSPQPGRGGAHLSLARSRESRRRPPPGVSIWTHSPYREKITRASAGRPWRSAPRPPTVALNPVVPGISAGAVRAPAAPACRQLQVQPEGGYQSSPRSSERATNSYVRSLTGERDLRRWSRGDLRFGDLDDAIGTIANTLRAGAGPGRLDCVPGPARHPGGPGGPGHHAYWRTPRRLAPGSAARPTHIMLTPLPADISSSRPKAVGFF